MIYRNLDALLKMHSERLGDRDESERVAIASSIHREFILRPFFEHVGSATQVSISNVMQPIEIPYMINASMQSLQAVAASHSVIAKDKGG